MKKIISLAMCLILLLSLCACGKSKQAKAVEEQISTIGDVSLEKETSVYKGCLLYTSRGV